MLYSTLFRYLLIILMYCVQGAGTGAVLDGVHVLGVPCGRPPLDHHDALGPLQICYTQGTA